ncbi:HD family phosphohydrolase [Chroococcus sp. FPU101]|uniref:HD family phosphohydrolase n=1 Tax=Chroococcus sp. FPU101 TaxID=1974212 RepID=UPI001A8EA2A7|nr:HDIG domain-containing metalloprotein [Chroococcus sp. FPU101]GFE72179.1 putative metal-dependent phosphohydrolase [Chroococcus sp. FPU101]
MKSSSFLTPQKIQVTSHFLPSLARFKKPLILLFSILCLTGVYGYHFYNQPQLAVNTISPITITAPQDGNFEDTKTTDEKRQKVRAGITPIVKRNEELTQQIQLDLSNIIQKLETLRKISQKPIVTEVNLISLKTQNYLITCSEQEWQQIINSKEAKTSFNPAIIKIQSYRQKIEPKKFKVLIDQIEEIRHQYQQVLQEIQIASPNLLNQTVEFSLLKISESNWQQLKQRITTALERILIQGLPSGLPLEHLQDTVNIHLKNSVLPQYQNFAQQLLLTVLQEQSNLEENKEATQQRASQAVEAVQPEMVAIKQGEIIVKAGEKITQKDFVLLDNFQLSRRGINWEGLGISSLLVMGGVGFFCCVENRVHRPMRQRDHLLLCLLSVSTPLFAIANIPYTNLAAVGLLTSSFYGPTLAITQILLVSNLSHFVLHTVSWPLIAGTVGGLLAAAIAGRLHSRDELSLLGAGVGLAQGLAYLIIYLIASATAGTIWYTVLPDAIIQGLSGLAWCIFALGISPYLERFFDLVTPIRLVELANPNRPLLQRLVTEAPGTFQHTLFVACLAEAAGRKLHCNVELIRAGTLYHDIGKMHDPLGFIENQMGGLNKHDVINNPWLSAEIIKKHISEGLVMARKYGLPKVVRDFIPEHQGTLPISYFYQQAKATNQLIDEQDFCYDGPIPQSRETGLVMLADSSEAALRSLKNATPEQAKDMINKIFAARWRENQLKDSGLRRDEMGMIAEVFIQVWQQYNHQRIAYPKSTLEPQYVRQPNSR